MALPNFRFEDLPRSRQILIVGILALGLAYVAYAYYFQPMMEQRGALQSEINQLEIEVAQSAAVSSQLKRFKAEVSSLEGRLATLRQILPEEKETPVVLRSVQEMASSSNLKIMKFGPQPVVPRAFYADWPIQLTVEGSYNALGRFFEKVSQYARIINVDDITIRAIENPESVRSLSAVCIATTFVFREDQAETSPGN